MTFNCINCCHAKVCVFKATYKEYCRVLEAATKEWTDETKDHLRATKDEVFSFRVDCKYWKM